MFFPIVKGFLRVIDDLPQVTVASTFAQRFAYTRDRQRVLGTWQEDAELATRIGVNASQISEYKGREESPPAKRTLAIAQICGVDPGWLAFGADSAAPAPERFDEWLAKRYPTTHLKGIQSAEPHFKRVPDQRGRKKKSPKRASG